MREVILTKEGVENLKSELENLKAVERPRILKEVKHAREYGDLRENFEYHAARQAQSLLESRIIELERMLSYAQVVDALDASTVRVGTKVKVKDLEVGDIEEYALLDGSQSANGYETISPSSPIGQALQGRSVGDVVQVEVPAGTLSYEVLEIDLLEA